MSTTEYSFSYLSSFRQEMTLSRCFILVSKWHLNFPKRQLPSPERNFINIKSLEFSQTEARISKTTIIMGHRLLEWFFNLLSPPDFSLLTPWFDCLSWCILSRGEIIVREQYGYGTIKVESPSISTLFFDNYRCVVI